ncbi:MAG: rhodanese-like domain-containing protein [Patescibacteria group bacterium]
MKHITREGLKQLIDEGKDIILLNTEAPEEFNERHIPGSINIYWRELAHKDNETKLPKDKTVVVYCGSFTCGASAKGAGILEVLGYTKLVEYDGGIKDWEAAGYPLEKGKSGKIK